MNEKRSVLASDDLGKDMRTVQALQRKHQVGVLTISVLQACCAVNTEYGIPSDFVRKSTASLQIKISAAQLIFSNSTIYSECRIINKGNETDKSITRVYYPALIS